MVSASSHNNADPLNSEAISHTSPTPSTASKTSDWCHVGDLSTNEQKFAISQSENLSSLSSCSNASSFEYSFKDDGKPSSNIHRDVLRTLKLVRQERHLLADELYQSVKVRMESYNTKLVNGVENHELEQNHSAAKHAVETQIDEFKKLEHRAHLFRRVKRDLIIEDDWILSHQTSCGLKTFYRREADKSLSIKIEGELNGAPVFEQIAVTREIDLYHHWAPLCTDSKKLGECGRLDVLAWQKIGACGLERDVCYRAIGCDSLAEDGCFFIAARGLSDNDDGKKLNTTGNLQSNESNTTGHTTFECAPPIEDEEQYGKYIDSYFERDPILKTTEKPPKPEGFGAARMELRKFECMIKVISPQSAYTCMISNIVPSFSLLPQSLIDFCMKRICGIMLLKLQAAAQHAANDPQNSVHAKRMQEDSKFYQDWCMPKVKHYCDLMGWEVPTIRAFGSESVESSKKIIANSDSDESVTESISVKSEPKEMPSLTYSQRASSLRASVMPENLMRSTSKHFSKEQILRMRQIKEIMRNPDVTLSDSVKAVDKKLILKRVNAFWDKMQDYCNEIPQQYIIPCLFVIIAVVLPANFGKHLVQDVPKTYSKFIVSNLLSFLVAVSALSFLTAVHSTVINLAVISAFNDFEMLNHGLENTKHLLIVKIRHYTMYLSGGTAAFAFIRAMLVVIFRVIYRQYCYVCIKIDSVWTPIKMVDAIDRTMFAILAEMIEKVASFPIMTLSSLVSPLYHRLNFISAMFGHTEAYDERYFFWKNVVFSTQVLLLYSAVFILISLFLILKVFTSITANDANDSNEEISPRHGNLYKIEEDAISVNGGSLSLSSSTKNGSILAQGKIKEDDVSTLSKKSKNSKDTKSSRKTVKKLLKFKGFKKKKKVTEKEVTHIPSPISFEKKDRRLSV